MEQLTRKCNVNSCKFRCLLVAMHGLRGYDSHLISKQAFEVNGQIGHRRNTWSPQFKREVHDILNMICQVHRFVPAHAIRFGEVSRGLL